MNLAWIAAGAVAGGLSVWWNAMQADRLRERYPKYEVQSWALFLVGAAVIYVGFAVFNGASARWTSVELAGVAAYGLVAWVGASRWPVLVGVGWLLHMLWDQVLHPGGSPGFVPSWYPALCLGFDVCVGAALIARFRPRTQTAF
jgi:hypothetical protein